MRTGRVGTSLGRGRGLVLNVLALPPRWFGFRFPPFLFVALVVFRDGDDACSATLDRVSQRDGNVGCIVNAST